MNRMAGLATLLIVALAAGTAVAGETQGTTLRFTLQPGQVLVYRAISDTEIRGQGRPLGGERETDAEAHLEMIFSLTAGDTGPDGSIAVTMEILDLKMIADIEMSGDTGRDKLRRRFEMDRSGIKIYDGNKLVQEVAWGGLNLPNAPDFPALLGGTFQTRMSPRAEVTHLEEPGRIKRLLQGANFLHLLQTWVVLPEGPIVKGSTWQVAQELVAANPINFKNIYTLEGTETYTAIEAVTHMKRSCLKVGIKGDWPKANVGGELEAEHSASGTAIVDFATGVTFAVSLNSTQHLEGTRGEAKGEFDLESRSTVTYIGGQQAYTHYKAQETAE